MISKLWMKKWGLGVGASQKCFENIAAKIILRIPKNNNWTNAGGGKDCSNPERHKCTFCFVFSKKLVNYQRIFSVLKSLNDKVDVISRLYWGTELPSKKNRDLYFFNDFVKNIMGFQECPPPEIFYYFWCYFPILGARNWIWFSKNIKLKLKSK